MAKKLVGKVSTQDIMDGLEGLTTSKLVARYGLAKDAFGKDSAQAKKIADILKARKEERDRLQAKEEEQRERARVQWCRKARLPFPIGEALCSFRLNSKAGTWTFVCARFDGLVLERDKSDYGYSSDLRPFLVFIDAAGKRYRTCINSEIGWRHGQDAYKDAPPPEIKADELRWQRNIDDALVAAFSGRPYSYSSSLSIVLGRSLLKEYFAVKATMLPSLGEDVKKFADLSRQLKEILDKTTDLIVPLGNHIGSGGRN